MRLSNFYVKEKTDDSNFRVYHLVTNLWASVQMVDAELYKYQQYIGTDLNISATALYKIYPLSKFMCEKIYHNEFPLEADEWNKIILPTALL